MRWMQTRAPAEQGYAAWRPRVGISKDGLLYALVSASPPWVRAMGIGQISTLPGNLGRSHRCLFVRVTSADAHMLFHPLTGSRCLRGEEVAGKSVNVRLSIWIPFQ